MPDLQTHPQSRPDSQTPYQPRAGSQPPQSGLGSRIAIVVVLIIVIVGVVLAVQARRKAAALKTASSRNAQPPVPVILGKAVQKDVPIYLDGLGTVQAFNTVTVHVRVDGQLKEVKFTEGQDVRVGDILAQIDPDPFRTAWEQAVAKKGQDEAQLANARLDLDRETKLFAAKIDSEQVYATQKALVNQLDAAVKADQAAIDNAKVQLDYTTVRAPLDGRTGIRLVDAGNIVHANDSNGIVVLTQLKPISVIFTLPEQMLDDIHKHSGAAEFQVFAVDRDNTNTIASGTLAVIDNQIDPSTATIKLKANFPNDDLRLWPGQFVNTRLLLTKRTNGIVVPAFVIQRGPDGAYAFVVDRQNSGDQPLEANPNADMNQRKMSLDGSDGATTGGQRGSGGRGGQGPVMSVKIQPVTVAQIEAGEALIDSGLKAGDTVVVDGQYKLQSGSKIRPAARGTSVDSGNKSVLE